MITLRNIGPMFDFETLYLHIYKMADYQYFEPISGNQAWYNSTIVQHFYKETP